MLQYLNGLDNTYNSLRSQLLMMNPLPSVEVAYSFLQQEETRRLILDHKPEVETSAMYSKRNNNNISKEKCTSCGNKGHSKDRWWQEIGYPHWHPLFKTHPHKGKFNQGYQGQGQKYFRGKQMAHNSHGNNGRGGHGGGRTAANVNTNHEKADGSVVFTRQQFEQLLR